MASRFALVLALGSALVMAGSTLAAERDWSPDPAREPQPEAGEQSFEEDLGIPVEPEEEEGLRERLTEREDKRRPLEPWTTPVAGRPLTVTGEWEVATAGVRRLVLDDPEVDPDRLLLETGVEAEVFYSFGAPLSLFAQVLVGLEEDLLPDGAQDLSSVWLERGEMWLYSEDIAGSHVNVDVGRLDFEDDRRWWWDVELDALRVALELETFEVVVAAAQELAPYRSDEREVEADQDGVLRIIGEVGWDVRESHGLELFCLHQDDGSTRPRPGRTFRAGREDESDARLTWLGGRAMGVFELPRGWLLGYWADAAFVRGREVLARLEEVAPRSSVVEETIERDVRGWAVDVGLNGLAPWWSEPRLFVGYAFGSGDERPDRGTDRAFRQTGLEENEAGFGGVQRFGSYGPLLDPELSNLGILTVGTGVSLLRSSSIDLVYHHYRQAEAAPFLRDARIEAELDGRHRDVGQEIDLVLALEEWEQLEFELIASAFRAGKAFGRRRGTWSYGGFFAMRFAF